MAELLDISEFEGDKKFISLGKIKPDIIAFLKKKAPNLISKVNYEKEILFWKDRFVWNWNKKLDYKNECGIMV